MEHGMSTKRRHKPIQPPSPSSDEEKRKSSVFRRLGHTHNPKIAVDLPPTRRVCRHWMARGRCDFGDSCNFEHPALPVHSSPPKKYVRPLQSHRPPQQDYNLNETQDDSTRIRSAVVVSKSETRKSRKVTIPEGGTDEPGAANYEFESALALEKQRQELQRRIDELDGSEQQPSSRGRQQTTPADQHLIVSSESDDETKLISSQDEKRQMQQSYSKPAKISSSRYFSQGFPAHGFRTTRRYLDKEEGELSDDPEKREARREKKLLQQTPPKVKQDDFQDVKQRSTPKTPKTPPKIEIEKSSSPKVRQQAVRDEPDRYKAKPAQEIVEQDRHDDEPVSQRRGVKRPRSRQDDHFDEKRKKIDSQVVIMRRDYVESSTFEQQRSPPPPPRRTVMKSSDARRDRPKDVSQKQMPVFKRDNYQQQHFRRKYEQYGHPRRDVHPRQVDSQANEVPRKFQHRTFERADESMRRRKPPPPPMQDYHRAPTPVAPVNERRGGGGVSRMWKEPPPLHHPQQQRRYDVSPNKNLTSQQDRSGNKRRPFPNDDFRETDETYARRKSHKTKMDTSRASRRGRSMESHPRSDGGRTPHSDRSYKPSRKTETSSAERRPSRSSTPVVDDTKLKPSPAHSSTSKKRDESSEPIVEKIETPELNEDDEKERTADDFEPISDEEVQDETAENVSTSNIERVDWGSLLVENDKEAVVEKRDETKPASALDRFKPENLFPTLSLQKDLLTPALVERIESLVNSKMASGEPEFRVTDGHALNRNKLTSASKRLQIINDIGDYRKALSARSDLKIRRQLCGLYVEEPYEHLSTNDINIPYNAEAYKRARDLFLKIRDSPVINKS